MCDDCLHFQSGNWKFPKGMAHDIRSLTLSQGMKIERREGRLSLAFLERALSKAEIDQLQFQR